VRWRTAARRLEGRQRGEPRQAVGLKRECPQFAEVPDLDYDLKTDDKLINTYAWLKADDLRATLRQRARFSVSEVIDKGKEMLLMGLNRTVGDAMTLGATVDSVAVKGLYVTRAGLIVRGEATGQAHVAVHQR